MDVETFDSVLRQISPFIQRQHTTMREAISAEDKLAITLRFLASGNSYHSLMYKFRVSLASISALIPEVCDALNDGLGSSLTVPASKHEWLKISQEFQDKWQFPHCLGAIDGKHIYMKAPAQSGSQFFNYKNRFSMVLLAIADANAKFVAYDLGSPGSNSDGGIFKDGKLGTLLARNNIPNPTSIGDRPHEVPYFLVGDSAFALDIGLMKPYSRRSASGEELVFNYRLCRARRVVENAFGVMAARFRVLLNTIETSVNTTVSVTRACMVLHNELIKTSTYNPPGFCDSEDAEGRIIPGSWRSEIQENQDSLFVSKRANNASSVNARVVRDILKDYFFEEGAVAFQWHMTE